MHNVVFFGDWDLTALVTTLFVMFFVGIVIYLRREDRREGYPLEDDVSGRLEPAMGLFFFAPPKTFIIPGRERGVTKPNDDRDRPVENARRTSRAPGSPLVPVGNPLLSGIGPASIAHRADEPNLTAHGETKIAPMRILPGFSIDDPANADPRGWPVYGKDGVKAGTVSDVWIDRVEYMIRYLEVARESGGSILLPMNLSTVQKGRRRVRVDAVLGAQFADAPVLTNPEQVTFLEEERICAYFGAGYLWAEPNRSEPFL